MAQPKDRFDDLCNLVARADPDRVRAELPGLFSADNYARDSIARRIGAFLEWRRKGGFEMVRVLAESKTQIDVELRFPVTQDHWRLRLVLEDRPAGLIDEMLMGRAPLPPVAAAISDKERAQRFLDYVTHLGAHDLFSGAVLIARNGTVLGQRAVGMASHEHDVPNTPETRFNVASLTKSWTATAVVRLIERGRLGFDTALDDLVTRAEGGFDRRIEIRHLLSNTSGLGDYFGPAFDGTPKDRIRSIDDFLALARSFEPSFDPGSRWSYSNIGIMLLGKVIERLMGQGYHEALRDLVLDPAGMTGAGFPHLDEINPGCASGYGFRWTDEGPVRINALHSWAVRGAPDGCAFATVRDIWAFAEAFRSGRLVSPEHVRLMTSAKPELGAPDYGFGFAVLPERAVFGHSGGLIGASSNLDMTCEPDGWTVVVLANDLSMRSPVIKARQLIGVHMQERDDARTNMPRAGLTAR